MAKKQFQTRLDEDVAAEVEAYQEKHNLTSAEAVRRLVATGIEREAEPTREEIAADLDRINESVDDVHDDLDALRQEVETETDDEPETRTLKSGAPSALAILQALITLGLLALLFGGAL
jgi:antitoxin component of RelBE/YafQ-DinJ toxin-antitoxin module